ncbi:hypothetical protein M8818_000063 [Zalaria obscura]|uniref:Uncharacterized protein n=1 Tax=Zalaria obscura TaxID=2024903 RepID=A0ACC3SNJ0_9PEZI
MWCRIEISVCCGSVRGISKLGRGSCVSGRLRLGVTRSLIRNGSWNLEICGAGTITIIAEYVMTPTTGPLSEAVISRGATPDPSPQESDGRCDRP